MASVSFSMIASFPAASKTPSMSFTWISPWFLLVGFVVQRYSTGAREISAAVLSRGVGPDVTLPVMGFQARNSAIA
jgi:hypothetical protein